jgi:hypothetical protein
MTGDMTSETHSTRKRNKRLTNKGKVLSRVQISKLMNSRGAVIGLSHPRETTKGKVQILTTVQT